MLEVRESERVEQPNQACAERPLEIDFAEAGVGTLVLTREDEEVGLDRPLWATGPIADGRRKDDDEDEDEDDDVDDDAEDDEGADDDADDDLDEEEFDDEDDEDFDDDDWDEEEDEK